jgi:hypothetical protein
VAGNEAAGPRAPAPLFDRAGGGLAHALVAGEAQVVIRRELEDRPPVDLDVRPRGRVERGEAAVKVPPLEVVQRLADEILICHRCLISM